jgi:hypothetical protein
MAMPEIGKFVVCIVISGRKIIEPGSKIKILRAQ